MSHDGVLTIMMSYQPYGASSLSIFIFWATLDNIEHPSEHFTWVPHQEPGWLWTLVAHHGPWWCILHLNDAPLLLNGALCFNKSSTTPQHSRSTTKHKLVAGFDHRWHTLDMSDTLGLKVAQYVPIVEYHAWRISAAAFFSMMLHTQL